MSITEIFPKSPANAFPDGPKFQKYTDKAVESIKPLHMSIGNHTAVNGTFNLEFKMDNFIEHLKSFVNGTHFNQIAFEGEAPGLIADLQTLEMNVQKGSSSRKLKHKRVFAKHLLGVMVESIENLKFYRALYVPGHRLVYKLIELNISALTLYDPNSEIANNVNDYMAKILELHHMLYYLRRKFKDLTSMIGDMRNMVRHQVKEAEQILETLWNLVPDPDRSDLPE